MNKKFIFILILSINYLVNCLENSTINNISYNENDWDNATWVISSSFIIITMQSFIIVF